MHRKIDNKEQKEIDMQRKIDNKEQIEMVVN